MGLSRPKLEAKVPVAAESLPERGGGLPLRVRQRWGSLVDTEGNGIICAFVRYLAARVWHREQESEKGVATKCAAEEVVCRPSSVVSDCADRLEWGVQGSAVTIVLKVHIPFWRGNW